MTNEITTSDSSWALRVLEKLSFSTVSLVFLKKSPLEDEVLLTIFHRMQVWKTLRVCVNAWVLTLFPLILGLLVFYLTESVLERKWLFVSYLTIVPVQLMSL